MKSKFTPIAAIIAIAGLEVYAISQGVNGAALAGVIGIIAGIAGYSVAKPK